MAGGKSTLLALYAVLRAVLDQSSSSGSKIVIVSGSFRQSKLIMEQIEGWYKDSPILQACCEIKEGLRRNNDKWEFQFGKSSIVALPLGDGQKIRGIRASTILVDEVACLTKETIVTKKDCFTTFEDIFSDKKMDIKAKENNIEIWADGRWRLSPEKFFNGVHPTKKIVTKEGYSIEGTNNHKLKVLRNMEIIWSPLSEIKIGDYLLIDREQRWHTGQGNVGIDEAYSLGLLTGDGWWTRPRSLGYSTIDLELVDSLNKTFKKKFKNSPSNIQSFNMYSTKDRNAWLKRWDLSVCKAKDKYIPKPMLSASKEAMSAYISGLFDTDGCVRVRNNNDICISFTNTSEKLIDQLQYIFLHYGIVTYKSQYRRQIKNHNTCWDLLIMGENIIKFAQQINFRLIRKKEKLLKAIEEKQKWRTHSDYIPINTNEMINIIENNRNNFLIYGSKQKYREIMPARLRTRKFINRNTINLFIERFGSIENVFINKIKNILNPNYFFAEVKEISESINETFDMFVPDENQYCANGFHSHNSVSEEIFNVVIRGFAAVSQNPVEKVRAIMRRDKLIRDGVHIDDVPDLPKGNQIIRSGTADYYFNHFYKTYEIYSKILTHKLKGFGDDPKIKEILGDKNNGGGIDKANYIDYRNYAIIQLPYTAIPKGFMDETMINEARLDISESQFDMEYNAKFITDSKGFFKASAIETATPKLDNPKYFRVELFGDLMAKYVMGIDPARKVDLFALCIIKVTREAHQIVYLNEWKQKNFGELALEIRRLKKLYNVSRIGIDQGGGGSAIMDFLSTKAMIPDGELPFFEIDSKEVTACEKIIEPINYMGSWLKSANYDLAADIEHQRLLFPYKGDYDIKNIGDAEKIDEVFDLIKELKKQLTQIEITATDRTEVEHFDLPPEMKWKQHKDLYSALLIAAYEARQVKQKEVRVVQLSSDAIGGSVDEFA